MIIVTGAAGFIGSNLIRKLNAENFNHIIAIDSFQNPTKIENLAGLRVSACIDREVFADWLDANQEEVDFIFHLGARTDTTEQDEVLLRTLNTDYSKMIWIKCCAYQIPLVYASSAATYGAGELGYTDDEALIPNLKPLNPYGASKQVFDEWALTQPKKPFFWAGLKFFNVYGPCEEHKGRMASVIHHALRQIKSTGRLTLFRSHRADYADGEQRRDFVFVGDVVEVMYWLMHHRRNSGIYNVGTGTARTFLDLARTVFGHFGKEEQIDFMDIPEDIRATYQYYTQAPMDKLRAIGFPHPFHSLEEGIAKMVD